MPPSSVPPAAGKVPAAPTTGTADSAPSLEDDAATLDDIYGSANYWQRSTTPAAKGAESAPSGKSPPHDTTLSTGDLIQDLTCRQLHGQVVYLENRLQLRPRVEIKVQSKVRA